MTKRIPPLATVLRYRNQRVINNFLRSYDMPDAQARLLFRDMLKFLWLGAKCDYAFPVLWTMFGLDEMWHSFILHTRDYREFCVKHFGVLIEHDPESYRHPRKKRGRGLSDRERAEVDALMDRAIDTVFEELGAATARRWFSTRFDKKALAAHHVFVRAKAA